MLRKISMSSDQELLYLEFPRREKELIQKVKKRFKGFYFAGRWETPFSRKVLSFAYRENFSGALDLIELFDGPLEQESPWKAVPIPQFRGKDRLRPYQIEALQFWKYNNGNGLLNDDQGTGKTCCSLSYLRAFPKETLPALIIVKSAVKYQWLEEYKEWGPAYPVEVLQGQTPYPLRKKTSYIINWDILRFWAQSLKEVGLKVVIADESQNGGNWEAKRTRALVSITRSTGKYLPLSGTPMKSKTSQLYPTLYLLNKKEFPSHKGFLHRYCDPQMGRNGWEYKGLTNWAELRTKMQGLVLRREKAEVMPWLPKKSRIIIPLPLQDESEYKKHFEGVKLKTRSELETLMRQAFMSKMVSLLDWLEDFLESGEKFVIFAFHHIVIDKIMDHFGERAVKIDGRDSDKNKELAKSAFIENPIIRLLVGNYQAAGEGVSGLEKVCWNCGFAQFSWNPSDMVQAEDRLHRGDQSEPVNAFYFAGIGTIDEAFLSVIKRKSSMFRKILPGEPVQNIDMVSEILKEMKNEFD